ncbi:unnamed protein product [Ixodes hexagonus]
MAKGRQDPTCGAPQVQLQSELTKLRQKAIRAGLSDSAISSCVLEKLNQVQEKVRTRPRYRPTLRWALVSLVVAVAFAAGGGWEFTEFRDWPCVVDRGGIFLELTRPITSCHFCETPTSVVELSEMTKEDFLRLGYSDKPIVLRGAARRWKAMTAFSFAFFRELYGNVSDSLRNNRDYCQFFKYKTEFEDLEEFLRMPDSRAELTDPDAKTWYVGWSNCDQRVARVLRQYYARPEFLPQDSEASVIDWIFMGYSGNGATTHLDYVQRPSWQAQIRGTKTWTLLPPPECEEVCVRSLTVTVRPGDLVMLNTNRWYHSTWVEPGDLSITIGSEYD